MKYILITMCFLIFSAANAQDYPDILTPVKKQNSPDLKIACVIGLNFSNYSNDRFLDNAAFDVGNISGEYDAYGSGTGLGYNFGAEIEVPFNTFFSYYFLLNYSKSKFSSSGEVEEPCFKDSMQMIGLTKNNFKVELNYFSVSPNLKFRFTNSYFALGFSGDYTLSSSYIAQREQVNQDCKFIDRTNYNEIKSEVPKIVAIHYAFRLTYGLIYQITNRLEWSPEVAFNFGIYSINKSPNSDLGIYYLNSSFRFSL